MRTAGRFAIQTYLRRYDRLIGRKNAAVLHLIVNIASAEGQTADKNRARERGDDRRQIELNHTDLPRRGRCY
jgi:hypothetical protein